MALRVHREIGRRRAEIVWKTAAEETVRVRPETQTENTNYAKKTQISETKNRRSRGLIEDDVQLGTERLGPILSIVCLAKSWAPVNVNPRSDQKRDVVLVSGFKFLLGF